MRQWSRPGGGMPGSTQCMAQLRSRGSQEGAFRWPWCHPQSDHWSGSPWALHGPQSHWAPWMAPCREHLVYNALDNA